tara:strand:- start:1400 stop:1867 length:468 start_codon:yes stop_codon:yes gene_type:complete
MIRKATIEDIPRICELGLAEWILEKGWATGVDWSLNTTWGNLATVITDDRAGELFVAEDDDKIVGFFLAHYEAFTTDMVPVCHEVAWFVDPAYRDRGHGFKLAEAVEEAARVKGVKSMSLGISLNVTKHEKLLEQYTRRGYHPFQLMAFKRLDQE